MPDPRFYEALGPVTLREIAAHTGAEPAVTFSAEREIASVAPLQDAGSADVAFFSDRRYRADLGATSAAAVFVTAAHVTDVPAGCIALVTAEPQAAYARAAARLCRPRPFAGESAVDPSAWLEAGVTIAPGVTVGPGAEIGRGTVIGPGAVIGPGVAIGCDCEIGPRAVILCALLGDRVRVLSGAVVGEAGFGVAGSRDGATDVPQLGRVILQDGVSVGANSCIDRGAWRDTVVGENTKIDNLVQIAHNVRLGRNCVLAAHTGISGSVVVGDGVQFGGRAGIADHVEIGRGASIAAAAGVMKDVPAGETWGGSPARPVRTWLRESAWLHKMAAPKRNLRVADSNED